MKILMVHPHIRVGGAEKHLLYLSSYLNRYGFDISILTISYDDLNLPIHIDGLNIYKACEEYDGSVKSNSIEDVFKDMLILRRSLSGLCDGYDAVIAWNFPSYWSIASLDNVFKIWNSCEVFAPLDEFRELYVTSGLFRLLYNAAKIFDEAIVRRYIDRLITVSKYNLRAILSRYGRDAYIIPPGVDYRFYNNRVHDAKDVLGLKDRFIILHVGRLVARKNFHLTLYALAMLKKVIPEIFLLIVGDGPYRRYIDSLISRYKLKEYVRIYSNVDEYLLRTIYWASDLNIYPVSNQSFGLVPIEALSAGTASLVSRDSGVYEYLGKYNIFIPIDPNPNEIYNAVKWAYDNPDKLKDMVSRGMYYVRKLLDWSVIARKYSEVIHNIVFNGS